MPTISLDRRVWAAVVVSIVLSVTIGACGDDSEGTLTVVGPSSTTTSRPETSTTTSSTPTSSPQSTTTSLAEQEVACRVGRQPSGPVRAGSGAVAQQVGRPTVDEPLSEATFDWNGDGAPDVLAFDGRRSTVAVDWGSGRIVVAGVRSDFRGEPGIPVLPGGAPFLEPPGRSTRPAASPDDEGLAAPTPAAVADVTGDDRPDLIVLSGGRVSVLVGAGSQATPARLRVADIGTRVEGWRNPPVTPRANRGSAAQQIPIPYDVGTVVPVADFDDDGVDDIRVDSWLPRARGPVAYYSGRPCR